MSLVTLGLEAENLLQKDFREHSLVPSEWVKFHWWLLRLWWNLTHDYDFTFSQGSFCLLWTNLFLRKFPVHLKLESLELLPIGPSYFSLELLNLWRVQSLLHGVKIKRPVLWPRSKVIIFFRLYSLVSFPSFVHHSFGSTHSSSSCPLDTVH